MKEIIQIGILGCGEMGRKLAQAVTVSGLGRISTVFDSNPVKGRMLAQAYQARFANSASDMLENDHLQAVMIALPPFLHGESVFRAAQAGKHIFLEKPMALDLATCHAMNEAVRMAGKRLMVGHVLRYFEPFRTITHLARTGTFGRPLYGTFSRFESDYLKLAPWKGQRALSGGYLYEIGAHGLDWLRCLFGEPTDVRGSVQKKWPSEHQIEDFVSAHIHFDSGAFANFWGGAGFQEQAHRFALHFERATISSPNAFDTGALHIEWAHGFKPAQPIVFQNHDPFEAEIVDWLKSLINGTSVPITGEDAAGTVALIESIYESAGFPS